MIIDMLDNDIIKDLKFPTCQFENNSSGKLLLNILFAISKEYSEHLSEVVQRGIDTNLEQGKSAGKAVWGYERDQKTEFYEPDACDWAAKPKLKSPSFGRITMLYGKTKARKQKIALLNYTQNSKRQRFSATPYITVFLFKPGRNGI